MGRSNKDIYSDSSSRYPEYIATLAKNLEYFGKMDEFTVSTSIKGPCGDKIEFYLVVEDRIIKKIRFYTQGCISTIVCGERVAQLALGRPIDEALGISPKQVKDSLKGLPKSHNHCSILAVSVLYKAIAYYLIKDNIKL